MKILPKPHVTVFLQRVKYTLISLEYGLMTHNFLKLSNPTRFPSIFTKVETVTLSCSQNDRTHAWRTHTHHVQEEQRCLPYSQKKKKKKKKKRKIYFITLSISKFSFLFIYLRSIFLKILSLLVFRFHHKLNSSVALKFVFYL